MRGAWLKADPAKASAMGKIGGVRSGQVRGINRHTDDYKRGYNAGWASAAYFYTKGAGRPVGGRRTREDPSGKC